MRNKQQSLASTPRTPTSLVSPILPSISPPVSGSSSYSSLLTPAQATPSEKQDSVNPFLYSKEDLLQVWKDGGGHGGLGLEVELWEGVVREVGNEPISLKEMNEGEKKVCGVPTFHPSALSIIYTRPSFATRQFRFCSYFLFLSIQSFGAASHMTSYRTSVQLRIVKSIPIQIPVHIVH